MKTANENKSEHSLDALLEAYGARCRRVKTGSSFDRRVLGALDRNRSLPRRNPAPALWRHMLIAASVSLLIGLGVLFRDPFSARLNSSAQVTPSPEETLSIIRETLFLVSDELRRGTSLAVEYVDPTPTHIDK